MALALTILEDRRRHRRLAREAWPAMVSGRIRPGHVARVIDLSVSGALSETAQRFSPGGWAEFQLETADQRHITRVAIIRCYVSEMRADALLFRSALAFDRCIPWLERAGDPANLLEMGELPSRP
jgi:hypothetical protein